METIHTKNFHGLLPIVKRMNRAHAMLCAAEGILIKDYCGFRSFEEQAKLYNQGRTIEGKIVTNALPGQSFHQYGVAKDAVPIIDGKAIWDDDKLWEIIGIKGKSLGFDWGGDWESLPDKVHFQLTGGLTINDLAARRHNELNAYLEGWLAGTGLIKTLELAEKDL